MKSLRQTLVYHWPWIAWLLGILIALSIPGNYVPKLVTFKDWLSLDKIVHIILFAGLVFLSLRSFMNQYQKKHYWLITTMVLTISAGIGGLTEIMQKHVLSGRNGNVFDFGADALGCLTGLFIYNLVEQKKLGKI